MLSIIEAAAIDPDSQTAENMYSRRELIMNEVSLLKLFLYYFNNNELLLNNYTLYSVN